MRLLLAEAHSRADEKAAADRIIQLCLRVRVTTGAKTDKRRLLIEQVIDPAKHLESVVYVPVRTEIPVKYFIDRELCVRVRIRSESEFPDQLYVSANSQIATAIHSAEQSSEIGRCPDEIAGTGSAHESGAVDRRQTGNEYRLVRKLPGGDPLQIQCCSATAYSHAIRQIEAVIQLQIDSVNRPRLYVKKRRIDQIDVAQRIAHNRLAFRSAVIECCEARIDECLGAYLADCLVDLNIPVVDRNREPLRERRCQNDPDGDGIRLFLPFYASPLPRQRGHSTSLRP